MENFIRIHNVVNEFYTFDLMETACNFKIFFSLYCILLMYEGKMAPRNLIALLKNGKIISQSFNCVLTAPL